MQQVTGADQIESTLIRQLYVYWRSKCREGAIPRRADIDPAEIPRLMPNLLIADIEYHPFRIKYRLVGTKVVETTGFEFTGKYLDEIILSDYEGPFLECYQTACATKLPMMGRIKWHIDSETTGEYDICILPLSDDGKIVNKAISIECYENLERDYTFLSRNRYLPGLRKT
ncbi:MAG: PAS domain-containing protein [Kiloniellaceae bacterium]